MNHERVPQTAPAIGLRGSALALLTGLLWAGNPVAVSYSIDTLPPIAVAGVRFAVAAVFMLFWCRWEGSDLRLRPGQFLPVAIAGLALFTQIALFNVGVMLSNSSHASMMINTFVFWVIVTDHFVTKNDRISLRKLTGLALASAGILLILSQEASVVDPVPRTGDAPTLLGDMVLLASALILGMKVVYTKQALRRVEPGKLIFWHDVIGMVLFFAYSGLLEEVSFSGFTLPAVLGLGYQGVLVAGLCFAIQALLLRRHTASQIAVFSFATPLFGVMLGVLLRGDQLGPGLFVAAALVALGILLVNLRRAESG